MVDRSLIAGANAWFRAAESQRSDRILDDPWAVHLAERDPRVQAIRFGRFVIPPLRREIEELQAAHCVRHRAIDELVVRATRDGFRQVVIIGAGYDMRAFRLRMDGLRVFEIDHPATQSRKIERLKRLRLREGPVTRVAADLQVDDVATVLARAGWEGSQPTAFVAEGVIHYLSMDRLEALLSSSARAHQRRWILSFIRSDMYGKRDIVFDQLIRIVHEIPRLHFTPDQLRALLARHGLSHTRVWTGEEQVQELVPQARGRRFRLSQDVAQGDL